MIKMDDLIKRIIDFRDSRKWNETDKPESIAKAISIEAAELLENFQWKSNVDDLTNVKDELADILFLVLTLIHDLNLDVKEIIENKLEKIAEKYPQKN